MPLYLLGFALAGGEAAALYALGFASALPLAPQVAAPPPFGAYHDLRWLFTFSSSWYAVAWQLAALLAFRSALTAVQARLAWPAEAEPPGMRSLLLRSTAATALSVVALSPWATLAFASSAMSYSYFTLGSIIAVAATAVVLPSVAAAGAWWRRLLAWRAMLWTVAVWVAVMVEALAVGYAPGWVAVPAAAAGGVLNAALWRAQLGEVVRSAPVRRRAVPLSPVALAGVLALFLVGGGYLVGGATGTNTSTAASRGVGGGGSGTLAGGAGSGLALLYVPGFSSSYDGKPFRMLGRQVWHYSYKGLTGAGRPAAYRSSRTHQSLGRSARTLARQVDVLARRSGKPVALLADSEGSLVVRTYLHRRPSPQVRMFVEASPLIRPARVFFPPPGRSGYGIAAGWEARGLLGLVGALNPGFDLQADLPFVRSTIANAGWLRAAPLCPARSVKVFALVPFSGALTVVTRPVSRVPWTAIPGYHGTLLDDVGVQRDVLATLRTGRLPGHEKSTAAFPVISAAAAAWQVPALPLDLRPAWRSPGRTDAAFADWRCPATSR